MISFSKPGNRLFPGFLFAFVLSALLFLCLSFPLIEKFIVEDAERGIPLLVLNKKKNLEFAVSYIHSVNKSKITDFFIIGKQGEIILVSSRFSSFGAGVETFPEKESFFLLEDNKYIEYTGIDRKIEDLVVFVGTVADHTLLLGDREIHLSALAPPQTSLRFRAGRLSLFQLAIYSLKKGALHAD